MEEVKPYQQKKIHKTYRISQQHISVEIDFQNNVVAILPFKDYKIWIYFSNGIWQIW